MTSHWVQVRKDLGELIVPDKANSDLFLTEVNEYHSADGQTWKRLADAWELYTDGTTEAIQLYGPTITWTLDEVLASIGNGVEVDRYTEPAVTGNRWSVDNAGIRREFAAETMPEGVEAE